MWSYTSATPAYRRFCTGTIIPLPCNSLLLLSVNQFGIIFMNVCSGVVTRTPILSAGFDVLTPVTIKGAVCCAATPFHCVELRHCFQNEKPAVQIVRAEEHTYEQRIGQGQEDRDRRCEPVPF